ncbi:type II CAAX endopeptidase family protein [Brachybacterium paraconglomeratum]|uniref:CPBP family intramembrane glutamic endopeptidase n=1 Tax=Brachybacterium paraconglomeratum TaxID=173362 RepID=UPI0031ECB799
MVAVLSGIFLTAIVVTALRSPQGIVVSADPGYAPIALPLLLVPAVLTVALTLVLPTGRGTGAVIARSRRCATTESSGLIALALSFVLLVPVLPLPEDYVLLKFAIFLVIPMLVLGARRRRHGSSVEFPRPQVSPWLLAVPAVVLGLLSSVGPFSPGMPSSWPPLPMLIIAATATAITAGLGEEVLFRRLLQTRLEALVGPWSGILTASLLFGLLHVFSHGEGPLWATAAQVIALQGTTGIALGVIWNRWRRLWPCVLAHVLLNGFAVLLHLVGFSH